MFIKKSLKNAYTFLTKKTFTNCQATYQKELYLLFEKSGNFFSQSGHRDRLDPLHVHFCSLFKVLYLGSNEKKNPG